MADVVPTAAEHEGAIKQKVKDAFKQWDVNADGHISKNEMKAVLIKLLKKDNDVSEEDVEEFMLDADKNQNGIIEYDEFLDWILRPGAKMTTGASGHIHTFDLQEVLKPLYDVYDKNRDGKVSWEEFEECFVILANSLQLSQPTGSKKSVNLPWEADEGKDVFTRIDKDKDRWVSFSEFCEWQREALANSGLHNEDLKELIPGLARQLRRVYELSEDVQKAQATDQRTLERIIGNIADFTRDLWNAEKAAESRMNKSSTFYNRWTEPPIGFNINKLKGMHMRLVPGMMLGVEKLDLEILAIPMPPDSADEPPVREDREWLAKVIQMITLRNGKVQKDAPIFYRFSDLAWASEEGGAAAFEDALSKMSPELRVFCQLKTEANFGTNIGWQQIQSSLQASELAGWIAKDQVKLYNDHMTALMFKEMKANKDEVRKLDEALVSEAMDESLSMAPRSVMAKLSELDIYQVSGIWADFME